MSKSVVIARSTGTALNAFARRMATKAVSDWTPPPRSVVMALRSFEYGRLRTMAVKAKLTETMVGCLKVLAQRYPERVWYAAFFPYRSSHSLTALEKRGMVDYVKAEGWRITPAGAAAINRADLFAQPATAAQDADGGARWTDAELSAYDPDEPFPPARPGQMIFPAESEQYQYEIAALKKLLSDTVIERDAGNAERLRLRAALEKALFTLNTDFDISLRVRRTKELLSEALADEPVAQGDGAE